MDATRRALLGAAALGATGLALMQNATGAAGSEKGDPGAGGYGRNAVQLPPGAKVSYHDPKDIEAMWHTSADESYYYLRGKGQVAIFGSGGRSKLTDVKTGDAVYIPAGFGHAIKNVGDEPLEIVQTWGNGKFEEIDLDRMVRASPNYLLSNNFH